MEHKDEHIHDDYACCECLSKKHCCCDCPAFGGPEDKPEDPDAYDADGVYIE